MKQKVFFTIPDHISGIKKQSVVFLILLVAILSGPVDIFASWPDNVATGEQQLVVSGVVKDESGQPMPG
ncbi:MAG: hypothetical protein HPY62_09875, partial [Bacteroidales bacterium]|nr:hypothetical protein [Bacteroidales bacterium]